jgi:hypothetical protein
MGRHQESKQECSFLKKRTKKLPGIWIGLVKRPAAQMNKSLFASFFAKKEDSVLLTTLILEQTMKTLYK